MLEVAKRDEKANIVANPIKNCVSSRSGYSSRICISRSHCTCKWFSNLKRFRWNLSNVAAWKMLEVAKRDEKANIAAKDCVAHWEEHRIDLLNPNTTTANQELPCSVTLWLQIFAILFKNSDLSIFSHKMLQTVHCVNPIIPVQFFGIFWKKNSMCYGHFPTLNG